MGANTLPMILLNNPSAFGATGTLVRFRASTRLMTRVTLITGIAPLATNGRRASVLIPTGNLEWLSSMIYTAIRPRNRVLRVRGACF